MDNDDEVEIRNSLNYLYENETNLTNRVNSLTLVNELISSQIQNITKHINKKQLQIGNYLNKLADYLKNKILNMEDEIRFLEHIYQINNDISLLRNHIDDIGQIIFSCKLGVIPSDIFTRTELDLIDDFDSYTNSKVAVALQDKNIILIIQIPKYSQNTLSKIIFEPIPNTNNKSINLKMHEILVDSKDNIFDTNIKNNLQRNLIKLSDECLSSIINFEEAQCNMQTMNDTQVSEIIAGILVFKNFYSKIEHNCNKINIKIRGNFIIKFENCEIKALNKTFSNIKMKIYDKFILPNFITKIREKNETIPNLKLETLYVEQIKHAESIQQIIKQNDNSNLLNFCINTTIIFVIIILTIYLINNIKSKMSIVQISSEPQTNGGGVIIKPLNII